MTVGVTTAIINELSCGSILIFGEVNTYRCQSATSIDRTIQFWRSTDINCCIAANGTSRQFCSRESTATTEDVTIHVGSTAHTDFGTTRDIHHCISRDVTILSTTKHRTEDARCTTHLHTCVPNVGVHSEVFTLVTLTTTKEVTGHRLLQNIFIRTRHA